MRQESALQAEGKAGCPHLGMWREAGNSPVRLVRQRDGAWGPDPAREGKRMRAHHQLPWQPRNKEGGGEKRREGGLSEKSCIVLLQPGLSPPSRCLVYNSRALYHLPHLTPLNLGMDKIL